MTSHNMCYAVKTLLKCAEYVELFSCSHVTESSGLSVCQANIDVTVPNPCNVISITAQGTRGRCCSPNGILASLSVSAVTQGEANWREGSHASTTQLAESEGSHR